MINFLDGIRAHIVSTLKSMQLKEEHYKAFKFGLFEKRKNIGKNFSNSIKKNKKV